MKLQERIIHVREIHKLIIEEIAALEVQIAVRRMHAKALSGTVQELLENERRIVNAGSKCDCGIHELKK